MKIKDLKPYDKNPRKITDESKTNLEASMIEYGDLSGIVFNRRSGNLVGGHQRRFVLPDEAEIKIEHTFNPPTPAGTIAEGFIVYKGEMFKFREVDWDKPKEIGANLAANKGAGQWDYPLLTEHLNFLDENNYDLNLTMFDKNEIENLLGGWSSDIESLDKIDENLDGIMGKIKITCPQEIKDEVLIFLKSKLMETSFEGVHIE